MKRVVSSVLVCLCAAHLWAQATLPVTEKIEWTWTDRPDSPVSALPMYSLSATPSRADTIATAKELDGVANVYLFATSASSSDKRLPGQLRDYFAMMGLRFA